MTDEQRIAELLREANPVAHPGDAMRVVRQTDPLWQIIRTRLDRAASLPDGFYEDAQATGAEGKGTTMSTTDTEHTRTAPQRKWVVAATVVAVLAVAAALVVALQQASDPQPDVVDSLDIRSSLPAFVLPPDQLAAAVPVTGDTVTVQPGGDAPEAPVDCTAMGLAPTESQHHYALGGPEGDRLGVGINVRRYADTPTAQQRIDKIHDEIQDCDASEHPMFLGQLETIQTVQTTQPGSRAFFLALTNADGRGCWGFAQAGELVATVFIFGDRGDADLTLEHCETATRLTAQQLS